MASVEKWVKDIFEICLETRVSLDLKALTVVMHKLTMLESPCSYKVNKFYCTTGFTTWFSCTIDLHRASWLIMQWRKLTSWSVYSSFTFCWTLFISATFIPVKFRDPSVVTLASLLQGSIILSMTADTLQFSFQGLHEQKLPRNHKPVVNPSDKNYELSNVFFIQC